MILTRKFFYANIKDDKHLECRDKVEFLLLYLFINFVFTFVCKEPSRN